MSASFFSRLAAAASEARGAGMRSTIVRHVARNRLGQRGRTGQHIMQPGPRRQQTASKVVAPEWFAKYSATWAVNHGDRVIRRFERDIFPWVGGRPVAGLAEAPRLSLRIQVDEQHAHSLRPRHAARLMAMVVLAQPSGHRLMGGKINNKFVSALFFTKFITWDMRELPTVWLIAALVADSTFKNPESHRRVRYTCLQYFSLERKPQCVLRQA